MRATIGPILSGVLCVALAHCSSESTPAGTGGALFGGGGSSTGGGAQGG